jgi:acyl-CoA thioester hydrolase
MVKRYPPAASGLTDRTETRVRFSEIDSIGIVWHGHFVKYLEDGRESFGRRFSLGYSDVYESGLLTPLVKLEMDYKQQVKYGDEIVIETTYVNCQASKIILHYRLFRKSDNALVLTANTVQVFVNKKGELQLNPPKFYLDWKRKNGLDQPCQ